MANETAKYDQRLKLVIKEFTDEFLEAFFPRWRRHFDASSPTWLDKEVFYNPPEGESGELDLVARLRVRGPIDRGQPDEEIFHIEVESGDSLASLRSRIHRYFQHIQIAHRLHVVSVGLYLHVGLAGRGVDHTEVRRPGGNRLRFDWPYIGLPRLDAERYIRKKNLLAVAFSVFMRIEPGRRGSHLARVLRKIARSSQPNHRKRMLAELAQKYLSLNAAEAEEFQERMATPAYEEAEHMAVTFFEQGIEKGTFNNALMLVDAKFGLTNAIRDRIAAMSLTELQNLLRQLIDPAKTLEDLGLIDAGAENLDPRERNGFGH